MYHDARLIGSGKSVELRSGSNSTGPYWCLQWFNGTMMTDQKYFAGDTAEADARKAFAEAESAPEILGEQRGLFVE
jgi:hypothetical protein